MLAYNNLTRLQKRYVNEIAKYKHMIPEWPVITLKQETAIHKLIRADHVARGTGIKIGFPTWMNETNKVDRGRYQIPVPTGDMPARQAGAPRARKNTAGESFGDMLLEIPEYDSGESISDFCREAGINIDFQGA